VALDTTVERKEERLTVVLSNSEWQAKINKLADLVPEWTTGTPNNQDRQQHQDQLCACGCGFVVPPGRTFVNQDHQVRWLRAGGGRKAAQMRWRKK
jgi:hypothetical protein